MKLIVAGLIALFATSQAQSCSHDLEVRCIDDINKGNHFFYS
jgi:hypothetical protein